MKKCAIDHCAIKSNLGILYARPRLNVCTCTRECYNEDFSLKTVSDR